MAAAQATTTPSPVLGHIGVRKTVQEMPAWPFRNTAAFGRAVLVASAPLIYATLNELIKICWIQPLSR
ncbi:MAG: hypothetical protein M3N29_02170 [Chloroflexota bacterium]|nr:hypothetical protein [Chloroflexota bacterium]